MTLDAEASKPIKSWYKVYPYLSSTWREFDPDNIWSAWSASVALGFPYMEMLLQTFKRKRHWSECGVTMGCYGWCIVSGTLLWRHNTMAVIASLNTRGPERDTY